MTLEQNLRHSAEKKGLSGEEEEHYVGGAIENMRKRGKLPKYGLRKGKGKESFSYLFTDWKHSDEREEVRMSGPRPTRPDSALEERAFKHTRFYREGRKLHEFSVRPTTKTQRDYDPKNSRIPEPTKGE